MDRVSSHLDGHGTVQWKLVTHGRDNLTGEFKGGQTWRWCACLIQRQQLRPSVYDVTNSDAALFCIEPNLKVSKPPWPGSETSRADGP